jgi:uncharacterized coiled-coil protein SlyX
MGDPNAGEAAGPTLRIQPTRTRTRVGRQQKTFDKLVDRITRQTRKLQRWQDYLPQLALRVERDMQPELDTKHALQRQLALRLAALLDQHHAPRPVANIHRQRVRGWSLALAQSVLAACGPDPELLTLRDRHGTGQDEVTRREQALALSRNGFRASFLEPDQRSGMLQALERYAVTS